MNILVLNYEYPPLGGGGAPVSRELAKGYAARGHRVTVVTMGYKDLPLFVEEDGVEVYRIKCWRSKKHMCHPWEQLSYLIRAKAFLRKHLKNNAYDVCHTHFLIPTGPLALWVKFWYGIPFIITGQGSDVPGYNPDRFQLLHKFTPPFIRMVLKGADQVITPSKFYQNLLCAQLGDFSNKCTVLPNGLISNDLKPAKKQKTIVSTGRLLQRKGFQDLIKAVHNLDTEWTVHLFGDGPYRTELEELAKGSKTEIVFHGWVNNQSEMYQKLLAEAGIFVLMSRNENVSLSLLEAMSLACAVITSDNNGCAETIGDAGMKVHPGNVEALKKNLQFLMNNEAERTELGASARRRVLNFYDWKKLTYDHIEVLTKIHQSQSQLNIEVDTETQ